MVAAQRRLHTGTNTDENKSAPVSKTSPKFSPQRLQKIGGRSHECYVIHSCSRKYSFGYSA
jgi:hypothetical protein